MIFKRGKKWQVKWEENLPSGRKQRSRTFDRKGDAETFERERRRHQQVAGLPFIASLERGAMTLIEFLASPAWLAVHGGLSRAQRAKYAWALEKHLPALLDLPLRDIDVSRLATEQLRMRDAGATVDTRQLVIGLLARVLDVARAHGEIPTNPARDLPRDGRRTPHEVQPLAPAELEQFLADLSGRSLAIALLGGHLGLSPIEIRSVPWHSLRDGLLHIRAEDTKVSRAHPRAIDVPKVTELALKAWRLESGGRGGEPIVGQMTESALKQWGTKVLRPRVREMTDDRILKGSTYTLRHSHASALHYAGFTIAEAARRLGHTQQTHVKHYNHVIDAIRGERYADLDALIDSARTKAEVTHSAGRIWGGIDGSS